MTTFETGYGPIDEDGGQLFYTDSGAVPNSTTYKTVFLFHGSVVNGNIFRRLLPLAASNNLRLVIPNRRDYAGSTRYTNEELLLLQQGKREFLETVAANTISFISWFVKKHDVPTLSPDHTTGGIITIGWSMGTCTPLSMLAYPDAISPALYATIEPYFKQMVLFDPPAVAFGSDTMPEYYVPFTDPELKSPEEMLSHFGVWVSSYYDHPDFASHSAEGLENRKHGDRNSLQNMTREEMAATLDQIAAVRSELPMFTPSMQPTLKEQAERALWDEAIIERVFPDLEIVHQYCTASIWSCAWAFFENERVLKEHNEAGKKVRQIKFVEIPGGNHFVHWDHPELYIDAILRAF